MKYPWGRENLKNLIKKRQRRFNKTMRLVNKNIEQDSLWRGRFVMRQLDRTISPYEDGSGATIRYKIGMYDKKTNRYAYGFIEDYNLAIFNDYVANRAMNKFITEIIDVWHNEEPKNDTTDYNNIKLNKNDCILIYDYSVFR